MPFNGAGTFVRIMNWVADKTSLIPITASRIDTDSNDFALGFNNVITRDGQGKPTAAIPFNSHKITGLGSGSARTDAFNAGNVQDGIALWGGTSTGSANAHAITVTTVPTAYTAGQRYSFIAGFTNTGATTLNVNSLGAKNIFVANSALSQGQIVSGQLINVFYDGTQFQILGPQAKAHYLLNVVNKTAAGATVYTPTAGTNFVFVELVGGGGGGGGCGATAASSVAPATGGGAGGYAAKFISSAFSGVTVTVGASGAGGVGSGGVPGTGGTSSFGALLSATGGSPGHGGLAGGGNGPLGSNGGAGGTGSSGDINFAGGSGGLALYAATLTTAASGNGGKSYFSGGGAGPCVIGTSGANGGAGALGSGGGGSVNGFSQSARTGGAGGVGFVRIWEFA